LGELGKKAFGQIEPRTAGRGKMQDKARMAFEPLFYLGMLMSAIIVGNEMNLQFPRGFALNLF
jgi:hypothetical protein